MEFLLTISTAQARIPLGTSPLFDLAVRNRSAKRAHFRYFRPTFWYPTLEDNQGHKYQAVCPPYDGPAQPVDLELKPGETRHFSANPCLFTDKPQGQIYLQAPAGKYRVSFQIGELRSSNQLNIVLETK